MNESWRQPKYQTSHLIDLRVKEQVRRRGVSAWRDVTAIRIIVALAIIIGRAFQVLFDFIAHIFARINTSKKAKPVKEIIVATKQRVNKGLEREIKAIARPSLKTHSIYFKLANFFLVLCLMALPFVAYATVIHFDVIKNSITKNTTKAFSYLFSAKTLIQNQDVNGAQSAFKSATQNFLQAQASLSDINKTLLDLVGLVPDNNLKLAAASKHILAAGQLSARLGADLATALTPLPNADILSFLDRFSTITGPSSDDAAALNRELQAIDPTILPSQYKDQFNALRTQATVIAPSLSEASILSKQAASFLGDQIDKRYLVVFQNNAELRGSGGFMGSFALVDFSQGKIKKITVPPGGTYDTEAGLTQRIVAPQPLWLLQPLWHMWDANWWPDWPTSAKKIEWFYEKSDGPTVDGVISLTPTVVERILAVHGPVDMTKDYGVIITADNFWQVTQAFSEQKPSTTNAPKKIIGDLITKLMEDLPKNMTTEKALALVKVLEDSLDQKQILVYLNDNSLESSVQSFGWDGAIKNTNDDYLMVTSTNIGGQKSDRTINETITHSSKILPDGQIIDTLKIERTHTAHKNDQFTGVRNVSWMRIYVPRGAKLISASGVQNPDPGFFKEPDATWSKDPDLASENSATIDPSSGTRIYDEDGKTVFANWSMVDPGQTTTLEYSYVLPYTLNNLSPRSWIDKITNYFSSTPSFVHSLLVQKQPGTLHTTFKSDFTISGQWQNLWQYPSNLNVSSDGWNIEQPLDTDFFATVLFHKP